MYLDIMLSLKEDWFLVSTEVLNHYLLITVGCPPGPCILPLFRFFTHADLFLSVLGHDISTVGDYTPTALYVCTRTLGNDGL